MSKVDNVVGNKFSLESQIHSVPVPLLELISLLVDGVSVDNKKIQSSYFVYIPIDCIKLSKKG